jgi:hypothetical protein
MSTEWVIALANGIPTGNPVAYNNFVALFPETSFPDTATTTVLTPYGYGTYALTPQPTPGTLEKVVAAPALYDASADEWQQAWAVVPMTPQEAQAATDAAYASLRWQRDQKLYACDWTQLPDVPLTPTQVTAWRTYRQQLRDYMGTVTDPFNPPAWPVPPS